MKIKPIFSMQDIVFTRNILGQDLSGDLRPIDPIISIGASVGLIRSGGDMYEYLSKDPFLSDVLQLAQASEEISVLWLYGSQVDQTATEDSDYDFGIAFRDFLKDPLDRRLRPEILAIEWTSKLHCPEGKISIVDINIAPITLAWEIVNKGVGVFVRDKDRLLREEFRVFRQFEIDVSYHRRIYG